MLSWLASKLISFVMERNRSGDVRATLMLDAPDVTLTFPGRNSWSGTFTGKAEVERWLKRLAAVGLQTYPDEVVATGWPWKTTICIRGHDHLDAPDGTRVYENRFVIWGHLAWGRLKDYEVYEDTHKPHDLDDWLQENRPELAAV